MNVSYGSSAPTKGIRLLTFNFHESFLCCLAHLGCQMDVVTDFNGQKLNWSPSARPPPDNIELISWSQALHRLKSGSYSAVVSHTVKNLLGVWGIRSMPHIFVAHIPLNFSSPLAALKSVFKQLAVWIFAIFHRMDFIAVSPWKLQTWHQNGHAISFFPIPFSKAFIAETLSSTAVTVGNRIRERGNEMGYGLLAQIRAKTNVLIIGNNPSEPFAQSCQTFEEFAKLFSTCGIYVFTISQPQGDGYNTAMLEAMLLRMPVVSIANPSSPIQNGFNGFVCRDAEEMIERIELLKSDHALREELGNNAFKTVTEKFSQSVFVSRWNAVLGQLIK
jgi:hypothetical protein